MVFYYHLTRTLFCVFTNFDFLGDSGELKSKLEATEKALRERDEVIKDLERRLFTTPTKAFSKDDASNISSRCSSSVLDRGDIADRAKSSSIAFDYSVSKTTMLCMMSTKVVFCFVLFQSTPPTRKALFPSQDQATSKQGAFKDHSDDGDVRVALQKAQDVILGKISGFIK